MDKPMSRETALSIARSIVSGEHPRRMYRSESLDEAASILAAMEAGIEENKPRIDAKYVAEWTLDALAGKYAGDLQAEKDGYGGEEPLLNPKIEEWINPESDGSHTIRLVAGGHRFLINVADFGESKD